MNLKMPCAVTALLLVLSISACGSSEDAPAGAKKLSFELTDEGCLPHAAKAPAGPITFEGENTGTAKVTEIEVMEGDKILGEKENLSDGLSGSFSPFGSPCAMSFTGPPPTQTPSKLTVPSGSRGAGSVRAGGRFTS